MIRVLPSIGISALYKAKQGSIDASLNGKAQPLRAAKTVKIG